MEKPKIIIEKSDKADKKYKAIVHGNKTVYFGQTGFSDMTLHKDPLRRDRYINRNKKNQEKFWNSRDGIDHASFYAKNILWNQPSLNKSIEDTNKRFNLNIKYKN